MTTPISPVLEASLPVRTTSSLGIGWDNKWDFEWDGTPYTSIREAYDASGVNDGYEQYVVASIVSAQAAHNKEMADILVEMRDTKIVEDSKVDEFWTNAMPQILSAIGKSLNEDRRLQSA